MAKSNEIIKTDIIEDGTYQSFPLRLYLADTDESILRRQNKRYTHSYNIQIKSAGTALVLIRSTSPLSESILEARIREGNDESVKYAFDIAYFQILASCHLTDTIMNNKDGLQFTGTITTNYRTSITAPSGASTPPTELFVANSLLARAGRQASRTYETIQSELIGTVGDGEGNYFYLVLVAAKENGNNGKDYYIFELSEGEEESEDADTLKAFFNSGLEEGEEDVSFVRILGHFPKDQPDFERFIAENYTITVTGNGNLTISNKIQETEENTEGE